MKLFITDLDGTLLDTDDDIGLENQKALQTLTNNGYYLVLASGRQMRDTTNLALKDIRPYRILLNGSQIFDDKKNLIYEATLPYEKAETIVSYCQSENIMFLIYTKDTRYVSLPSNLMRQLYDVAKTHGDDEDTIVKAMQIMYDMYAIYEPYTEDIALRLQQGHDHIYKIEVTHASSDVLEAFEKQLTKDISVSSSWPTNREITALDVNKGTALHKLCEYLDIPIQDCIAIGDSRNDLEMLSCAGYSIAMGNAKQEVKDMCDYITSPCSESGVAQAIQHILKKSQ